MSSFSNDTFQYSLTAKSTMLLYKWPFQHLVFEQNSNFRPSVQWWRRGAQRRRIIIARPNVSRLSKSVNMSAHIYIVCLPNL